LPTGLALYGGFLDAADSQADWFCDRAPGSLHADRGADGRVGWRSATSFAQTNANTQESISEKKAEGDHNSHYLLRLGERDCEKYQVFCFELVA